MEHFNRLSKDFACNLYYEIILVDRLKFNFKENKFVMLTKNPSANDIICVTKKWGWLKYKEVGKSRLQIGANSFYELWKNR